MTSIYTQQTSQVRSWAVSVEVQQHEHVAVNVKSRYVSFAYRSRVSTLDLWFAQQYRSAFVVFSSRFGWWKEKKADGMDDTYRPWKIAIPVQTEARHPLLTWPAVCWWITVQKLQMRKFPHPLPYHQWMEQATTRGNTIPQWRASIPGYDPPPPPYLSLSLTCSVCLSLFSFLIHFRTGEIHTLSKKSEKTLGGTHLKERLQVP